MNDSVMIRVSIEFKELVDYIRARCLLENGKTPTTTTITKIIKKQINKERLFQNEFA